jgi:hypothetical protein
VLTTDSKRALRKTSDVTDENHAIPNCRRIKTGNTAFSDNPHSIGAKPSFNYFSKIKFIRI